MNSKVIYATVFLSASLTMLGLNRTVFYPDGNVELASEATTYNAEANEVQDKQSMWDKITDALKPDVEPEIKLATNEETVLNTELDQLTDDAIISLFGAEAYDERGDVMPITVSKEEKSDSLITITFTAVTDSGISKSIDGTLNIEYNAKPKLTVDTRKIKIRLRKFKRYDEDGLIRYITRKSGLKCKDAEDGKIEPVFDLSELQAEEGEYSLTISATDSANQSTTIDIVLIIT